ncbi:DNA methyltransferase Dim-2 [Xylographa bjoerkii]|nr:DNA methyltransferase Dim-2 [Xylographa bjoerkii]
MQEFLEDESEDAITDEALGPRYTTTVLNCCQELGKFSDRKRKRATDAARQSFSGKGVSVETTGSELDFDVDKDEQEIGDISTRRNKSRSIQIRVPQLVFPKSAFLGWEPPFPAEVESTLLAELLASTMLVRDVVIDTKKDAKGNASFGGSYFTSLDLDEFSIYRPSQENGGGPRLSDELVALHDSITRTSRKPCYFDGLVLEGSDRHYVQKIPFRFLSVGGYDDLDTHTVRGQIWIQSLLGAEAIDGGMWYRLKTPSKEYNRYHTPFLWVADFAKHVLDFLRHHKKVTLNMFKYAFHTWLEETHGTDMSFKTWAQEYGDSDFRRVIIAHSKYILGQSLQLGGSYESHPLWEEVGPHPRQLNAVVRQQAREQLTVVTPLVYKCFKNMAFSKFLSPQEPEKPAWNGVELPKSFYSASKPAQTIRKSRGSMIKTETAGIICKGDVIKLSRDSSRDSKWKDDEPFWYAYVQRVEQTRNGKGLRVIWLDAPAHTTCSTMHYPETQELFLSDHCNCDERNPIPVDEVVSKISVSFFSGPGDLTTEFFVRQRFSREGSNFIELRTEHFECNCGKPRENKRYEEGDTVLVVYSTIDSALTLEPVELLDSVRPGAHDTVRVRRLLRKGRDFQDRDAEPNELVYSYMSEDVLVEKIVRPCLVRFYTVEDRANRKIPAPYCRQGTADAYYITFVQFTTGVELKPMTIPYIGSMKQGFDPWEKPLLPKLKGLSLFCGSGNFSRGIEEGGAVEECWAVDINEHAIHTYRANLAHPDKTKLYLGSVNDYLYQAMHESHSDVIACRGEVEVIIGGSPCQGFSLINHSRGNESAFRNMSLIASFAAFVDYYRPKYALLENVSSVAQCAEKNQRKNVLSQMLCAFTAMGYQVQQFHLDAWIFGSPQSRSRVIISIAAPGLVPMSPPAASHSHPRGVSNRTLGRAANSLPFSERVLDIATPFSYVTIGQATADLPDGFDGRATSVRFPDHRLSRFEDTRSRMRISCIPRFPNFSSIVAARAAGLLPQPLIDGHTLWDHKLRSRPDSRAWTRTSSDALLPTVITRPLPHDSFTGRALHWEEDRCLTVLEVRRAQGFPDHEVIVGLPSSQFKIVGNSVPRTMALVLGMSLRNAWLANTPDRSTNTSASLDAPVEVLSSGGSDTVDDFGEEDQKNLSISSNEAIPEESGSREIKSPSTPISAPCEREMMVGHPLGRKTTGNRRERQIPWKSVPSVIHSISSTERSTPKQMKASDTISISSDSPGDEEVLGLSFSQQSSITCDHIVNDNRTISEIIRSKRHSEGKTTIDDAKFIRTASSMSPASSSRPVRRSISRNKIVRPSNNYNPPSPGPKTSHRGTAVAKIVILD